jgi:hypothetical protein
MTFISPTATKATMDGAMFTKSSKVETQFLVTVVPTS